ncbi:DUF5682 family protein [Methylocucumis oryzae]|uniref:DUF5682 family protein n=1 Tax=Methylocucumis oryzae TaxID=1632867 RepID=UPI00103C6DDA|nr:DUF5682 family protein [Methylocucumis oryzae]
MPTTPATSSPRWQNVNNALQVLDNAELLDAWRQVLLRLADSDGIHAVIAGKAYRLLANAHVISPETVANALSLALSRAQDPTQAADWLEGLLAGAGLALLHDETLLAVLDTYVCGLNPERFDAITPLLRRTFFNLCPGRATRLAGQNSP